MPDYHNLVKEFLSLCVEAQASDLHLSIGHPPILRITGRLVPLLKEKKLTSQDTQELSFALMTESQRERFLREKEIDFSYDFEGKVRFRINIFFQSSSISAACRLIPSKIRTIEELNLPPILHTFTRSNQGFVLITGPSSHGKSTTLAALIDEIYHTRTDH